jgi:energy-coupling factor transport system substrate-specific component
VWIYRYYTGWSLGYQLSYLVAAVVSGAVVAGALSWYLVRALAATGVLAPFRSGRRQRLI